VGALKVGNPMDRGNHVGPLAREDLVEPRPASRRRRRRAHEAGSASFKISSTGTSEASCSRR